MIQPYERIIIREPWWWARQHDIHPQTACRWFPTGTLPVPSRKMGKIILVGDLEAGRVSSGLTAVYARVSSADQRDDLDRQVAHVCSWAVANGFSIDSVVTEIGSGLNDKRREIPGRLYSDPKVTTTLVEHRDRFARLGIRRVEQLREECSVSGLTNAHSTATAICVRLVASLIAAGAISLPLLASTTSPESTDHAAARDATS